MEAIIVGSEKQQAAALGLVATLITGMDDINDSILIYATFQDMIDFKQCVALSISLCTQLLQHDELQVRPHRELHYLSSRNGMASMDSSWVGC